MLRGEPDAFAPPPATRRGSRFAPAVAPALVRTASRRAAATPVPPVRPVVVAAPTPITKRTVEHLSPNADQTAVLRDLAERLQTRKDEPTVRYAGFFVRLGAFLIDGARARRSSRCRSPPPATSASAPACSCSASRTPIEADETILTILTAGWFAMADRLLHASSTAATARRSARSLLGLAVRTLDLREVGIVRCLIRTLGYAASSSFFGFGFLLVALTPRKRGWHDFLAGTCVVRLARDEASA